MPHYKPAKKYQQGIMMAGTLQFVIFKQQNHMPACHEKFPTASKATLK